MKSVLCCHLGSFTAAFICLTVNGYLFTSTMKAEPPGCALINYSFPTFNKWQL